MPETSRQPGRPGPPKPGRWMRGALRIVLAAGFAGLLGLPAALPAMAQQAPPIFLPPATGGLPANGPAPFTPLAALTSPTAGEHVKGIVAIDGSADWPNAAPPYNFQSYAVQWGAGTDPSHFNVISSPTSPNAGGQLATWDVSALPDGPYIVRLKVANNTGNYAEVRVPVIVDDSGSYSGPDFATSDPTPHPGVAKPSAIVTGSSSYTDPTSGQLHIVGEVQNNGNIALQFVQVTATLKDTSGNPVQSAIGFTLLNILVPGQKSPFDIFTIPPANLGSNADLSISFDTASNPPTGGLALSGAHLLFNGQGHLHLTGYLTNSSPDPAVSYHIVYTIFDSAGTPIRAGTFNLLNSVDGNPAQAPLLLPGTSGHFDYSIPDPPASFGSYSIGVQ
ncbi:MAG: FxLYD domain-containing protein [Chloroflexota bacterium]